MGLTLNQVQLRALIVAVVSVCVVPHCHLISYIYILNLYSMREYIIVLVHFIFILKSLQLSLAATSYCTQPIFGQGF
jgi:hypothetical protein